MLLNDTVCHGKPKADPFFLLFRGKKGLEELGEIFRRYTCASIIKADKDLTLFQEMLGFYAQQPPPIRLHDLGSVGDKIHKDLLKLVF